MAVITDGELQISGGADVLRLIEVAGFNNSAAYSGELKAVIGTAAWTRKKKGKRRPTTDEEARRDPLVVLGPDVMMEILTYLDAHSVALSLLVSRGWHGVASSDRLWSPMVRIRREDLCDHAWEFHFTKGAPEYWRNMDPYWKGTGPLMRRYFHPDGSLSADPDDLVWGGHECCYTVVTSIFHDGNIREHYVRINRWPQLCVSRRNDWGWEMSNFLYAYSSIPDAYKEGGTGPLLELI